MVFDVSYAEARVQPMGVGSLLPSESQRLNSGVQPWQQAPLSADCSISPALILEQ